MAAKEKVEAEVKVAEVKAADAKVEELKAKRLADKAKKHEERVAKHPKLGKAINWMDDHKWQVAGGIATGGVSFAAGWFGHKFFSSKKAADAITDVTEETTEEVAVEEPPFKA